MRVSVVQTVLRGFDRDDRLSQQEKEAWSHEEMKRCLFLVERAAKSGADLVVTIECANNELYEPLDGPYIHAFAAIAKASACYIAAGLHTQEGEQRYNSALLFDPQGDIACVYHKVHLPAGEEYSVSPGDCYQAIDTPFGKIALLVCWDLQFPEAARVLALMGADLIVCPTLGWEKIYGLSRAYENSVYLAIGMGVPWGREQWPWCDPSCIVDHMGRVLIEASRNEEQIISAEVDIRKEPAPQYFSQCVTGHNSMRQTRLLQRRPDTYGLLTQEHPPLVKRYQKDAEERT